MADRDLGEAGGAGDLGQPHLVRREAVAVHQDDGDGANAAGDHRGEGGKRGGLVERAQHLAVRRHPLVDLDDAGVERLGQDDRQVEQPRPRLMADPQRVAVPAGDCQADRLAGPLEQGVGRHRRAHADRGDGLAAGQPPDALAGGVGVERRLRQQFGGADAAVGGVGDDVGKGAAAVDGEAPGHLVPHRPARRLPTSPRRGEVARVLTGSPPGAPRSRRRSVRGCG